MPYEIPSTWDSGAPPRGWYRDAMGALQFWDGHGWAGVHPLAPKPRPVEPRRGPAWRSVVFGLAWIAAIVCLGSVLSGTSAAGIDCGTPFSPVVHADNRIQAACDAALDSRAGLAGTMALAALTGFAASSRVGVRAAGSTYARRTLSAA